MADTLPTQVPWKFNEGADGVAYNSADGNNGGWYHVVATKSETALPKLYVTGHYKPVHALIRLLDVDTSVL